MRFSFSLLSSITLAALLLALHPTTVQAQRRGAKETTSANADGSLSTSTAPARLRPLFGGLDVAQATQLLGATRLDDVAKSFASRAEASAFFSQKGYEYLNENKPDTAIYRFNLAWLLNPQNGDAYHGLGIIASRQPGSADQAMALLSQALVLAPTNSGVLTDLGTLSLIRYGQTKKKKDLATAAGYLQRAISAEPTNAAAWQSMARVHYYKEEYPAAWEAVHKGQALSMTSIDFDFIPELVAKLPDPQGIFK